MIAIQHHSIDILRIPPHTYLSNQGEFLHCPAGTFLSIPLLSVLSASRTSVVVLEGSEEAKEYILDCHHGAELMGAEQNFRLT